MSQDVPWAFGLRSAIQESEAFRQQVPVTEAPFFAVKGTDLGCFKVVGCDLEECLTKCIDKTYD